MEIDCPDGLRVVSDPGRLHQALGNLLSNSLHHAAPPITITASSRDGTVEIAVLDRGPGVEESMRGRLFDKFAHGSHEESTGLGLCSTFQPRARPAKAKTKRFEEQGLRVARSLRDGEPNLPAGRRS